MLVFRRRAARLLRKHVEQLTLGAVPARRRHKEWLSRKHIQCLDYGHLMRVEAPFQAACQAKLARLAERGLLDGETVRTLWSEHLAGRADHRGALMVLVCLEFVLEAFLDQGAQRGDPAGDAAATRSHR